MASILLRVRGRRVKGVRGVWRGCIGWCGIRRLIQLSGLLMAVMRMSAWRYLQDQYALDEDAMLDGNCGFFISVVNGY